MSFFPLDREILTSTLWADGTPEARVLWIYLLLSANVRTGTVTETIPGIALRSNLSVAAVRSGIEWLAAPDPDSRSPENDGRRIEIVEGGFRILNYEKYQNRDHSTARTRAFYERHPEKKRERSGTVGNGRERSGTTETETETETELTTDLSSDEPDDLSLPGVEKGPRVVNGVRLAANVKRKPKKAEVELWEFWKLVMRKSKAHVLDNKRLDAMRRALSNHTLIEMKKAVLGCRHSEFHQGKNDRDTKFNDIELICRDEKHFSEFIRLYQPGDEREYGEDFTEINA